MSTVYIVVYLWLSILFFWYGRYAKSSVFDRPLISNSIIGKFFFNLVCLAWIILTIYNLLFLDWRIVLGAFIVGFLARYVRIVEDIALFPLMILFKK